MKAVQLTRWESPPELTEIPVPEPGPGEVLLQVAAAGLCHSDLHLMEWPDGLLPYDLPFTLGHENAGYFAAGGSGVTGYWKGPGHELAPFLADRLRKANSATTHSITNVLIELDGDLAAVPTEGFARGARCPEDPSYGEAFQAAVGKR
jgi:NADPH:quinone reductase-like Zn-dependent oxidoreductase